MKMKQHSLLWSQCGFTDQAQKLPIVSLMIAITLAGLRHQVWEVLPCFVVTVSQTLSVPAASDSSVSVIKSYWIVHSHAHLCIKLLIYIYNKFSIFFLLKYCSVLETPNYNIFYVRYHEIGKLHSRHLINVLNESRYVIGQHPTDSESSNVIGGGFFRAQIADVQNGRGTVRNRTMGGWFHEYY